jgi:hypothetical protein
MLRLMPWSICHDGDALLTRVVFSGRLAMIAIGGIVHHYFITGKGPIELLTKP